MPGNIIICSDGTGNSANKGRGTNVFKLFEAIDLGTRSRQLAFYDDGVGTQRLKPLKLLGGAFGFGLSRNVRELYAQLVRSWDPGDRIFLFGFSRGAFTVRTLAGLVTTCGILDRTRIPPGELMRRVRQAYRAYRQSYGSVLGRFLGPLLRAFCPAPGTCRVEWAVKHPEHAPEGRARVHFIGAWDTVDAVGLPWDGLSGAINRLVYRFKFPDHELSPLVDRACHALSVDDERHTFHPLLWDVRRDPRPERIEQVWFPGAHSNVGGGYPRQGLSLVALDWMAERAESCGLRLRAGSRDGWRSAANAQDMLYDSRAGLAVYYRYLPRDIAATCAGSGVRPRLHESVLARIAQAPLDYAPGNLGPGFEVTGSGTASEADRAESRLADLLAGIQGEKKPLLDQSRIWLLLRRFSHHLLVLATLTIIVCAALLAEPAGHGRDWLQVVKALCSPQGLWRTVARSDVLITLAAVLLAAWGLGLLARRRMHACFARRWDALRPGLRVALRRGSREDEDVRS